MARPAAQQRFQNSLDTVAERPTPSPLVIPTSTAPPAFANSKTPSSDTPYTPWASLDSPVLGHMSPLSYQPPSRQMSVDAYLASSRCQLPQLKPVTPLSIKKLRRRGMSTDIALSIPETRPVLQLSIPSPSDLDAPSTSFSQSPSSGLAPTCTSLTSSSSLSPSDQPSPSTVNALSHLAHLALPTPAPGDSGKSQHLTVPNSRSLASPPQSALTFTAEWDFNQSSFIFTPFESVASPSPVFPRSPLSADGHDALISPPLVSPPIPPPPSIEGTSNGPCDIPHPQHISPLVPPTSFTLSPPSPEPQTQAEEPSESGVTVEFDTNIFSLPSPTPSLSLPVVLTPTYLNPRTPPIPGMERPNLRLDEHIAALPPSKLSVMCVAPSAHPHVERSTSPASSMSSGAQSPMSSIFDSPLCYSPGADARKMSSSTTASSLTDDGEFESQRSAHSRKGEVSTPNTPLDREKENGSHFPATAVATAPTAESPTSPKVNFQGTRKLKRPLPSPLRIEVPKRLGERLQESKMASQTPGSSCQAAVLSGTPQSGTRSANVPVPPRSVITPSAPTVRPLPRIPAGKEKAKEELLFPPALPSVTGAGPAGPTSTMPAAKVGALVNRGATQTRERSLSLPQKASVLSHSPQPLVPNRPPFVSQRGCSSPVPGPVRTASPAPHVSVMTSTDKGKGKSCEMRPQGEIQSSVPARQPVQARRRSNSLHSVSFLDLGTPTVEEYEVHPRPRPPLSAVEGPRPHTIFSALSEFPRSSSPAPPSERPKTPAGSALKWQFYNHFLKVLGSGNSRHG